MSNRPALSSLGNEAFFTPVSVVEDLLVLLGDKYAGSILDPCAGSGNIVRALRQSGYEGDITAVEPFSKHIEELWTALPNRVVQNDFFDCTNEGVNHGSNIGAFDLIIINPPFSMIEGFIEKAYNMHLNNPGKMAVLLRLGHLVGVRRWSFFQKYQPSSVHLLAQRPALTGGPGDIGGVAWVIFDKPMIINQTSLHWIAPKKLLLNNDTSRRRTKERTTQ